METWTGAGPGAGSVAGVDGVMRLVQQPVNSPPTSGERCVTDQVRYSLPWCECDSLWVRSATVRVREAASAAG
nr:hypothetical protein GCM10010200_071930 [Actinomadura rugatobispora]